MDYTKYKVKYSNQEIHERHDGILEVGRLRGALKCEVFGKQGKESGKEINKEKEEGYSTENRTAGKEEYWETEVVKDKWKGNSQGVKWGEGSKVYKLEKGAGIEIEQEIEGGWI